MEWSYRLSILYTKSFFRPYLVYDMVMRQIEVRHTFFLSFDAIWLNDYSYQVSKRFNDPLLRYLHFFSKNTYKVLYNNQI